MFAGLPIFFALRKRGALAYEALARELAIDTLVLVDGGTDSLLDGTESGLGTPSEDGEAWGLRPVHDCHSKLPGNSRPYCTTQ